jgi:hypothetical protein
MRLDIRGFPSARMMYSRSRLVSAISAPSGVRVSPSNSQGFKMFGRFYQPLCRAPRLTLFSGGLRIPE